MDFDPLPEGRLPQGLVRGPGQIQTRMNYSGQRLSACGLCRCAGNRRGEFGCAWPFKPFPRASYGVLRPLRASGRSRAAAPASSPLRCYSPFARGTMSEQTNYNIDLFSRRAFASTRSCRISACPGWAQGSPIDHRESGCSTSSGRATRLLSVGWTGLAGTTVT